MIKKIILKNGLVEPTEIDDFVQDNINSPEIQEIINQFKDNEDLLTDVIGKYGDKIIQFFTPNLIFIYVNDELIEQKQH